MSCDTNRKRLWRILKLNPFEMESIFYSAKNKVKDSKPSEDEKALWIEKTERLLSFFDYCEVARPVHSKTGLPKLSSLAGYAALLDALDEQQAMVVEEPKGIYREDLEKFLSKLGELAVKHNINIQLAILGGAAMVLGYSARQATIDIDAIFISPADKSIIRELIQSVANEFNIPDDWLNNAAQGFLKKIEIGKRVFSAPGIEVNLLIPEQLLASKLGSWRGKKDRLDAFRLMKEFDGMPKDELWNLLEPYLTPHQELRSQMAFDELWEKGYGNRS